MNRNRLAKKLNLSRTTVRNLSEREKARINGGCSEGFGYTGSCACYSERSCPAMCKE